MESDVRVFVKWSQSGAKREKKGNGLEQDVVLAQLLHEAGFVGLYLCQLGVLGRDGVGVVAVAVNVAARQCLAPGAGGGVSPKGVAEVLAVAVQGVALWRRISRMAVPLGMMRLMLALGTSLRTQLMMPWNILS